MAASAYLRRVSPRLVDALLVDPAKLRKTLFPSSTETMIDDEVLITIENWQALDQPWIETGGTPIGAESIGDALARGFSSTEVRKIAGKVGLVVTKDLPADTRTDFENLREFIMETAKAEAALIVYFG